MFFATLVTKLTGTIFPEVVTDILIVKETTRLTGTITHHKISTYLYHIHFYLLNTLFLFYIAFLNSHLLIENNDSEGVLCA
jgi:hypothetical protein